MAKQSSLFLPALVNSKAVQILPADTTSLKTLFTAGLNDSDVKAITVTSDDTSVRVVKLYITRSGTDYQLGAVSIPAASGNDGSAPAVDLINSTILPGLPIDSAGKRYLSLSYGDVLKVATTTTVTAAKTVTVSAFGQDY